MVGMSRKTISHAGGMPLAVLAVALAGCADFPSVQVLAEQPSLAQLQAVRSVSADYVYYPDYEIYHSRNHQEYVFRENGEWVAQATPPEIYADILQGARSAPLVGRDSPWQRHDEIAQMYPAMQRPASMNLASTR